jgi:DNA (cytosine-5)-methyltransferase 1
MAKFISLFAGVGGFDLGMEQAGHECVAQVEWDKNAAGVLKHRWPNVPLFCDVSKVSADDLPDADFITYGFPCQDLSVAGKREGLDGKRSGLFYEATRLIRELRTRGCGLRFAVAENVGGLLSADDGVALARCIRELLDSGACETGWRVVDSQYFGVAQRRKRVFIVSDFGGESCDQILAITESLPGHPAPSREAGKGTAGDATESVGEGGEIVGSLAARDYKGVGNQYFNEGKVIAQGGDLGGGSETLAVNIPEVDIVGTLSDGAHMGGGLKGQDAYTGRILAVQEPTAFGCDLSQKAEGIGYTKEVAPCIAPGTHAGHGSHVVSWNGDTTPKASEDVSQGVDVYNGQLTGDKSCTVTTNTGQGGGSGPKVMSFAPSDLKRGFGQKPEIELSGTLKKEHNDQSPHVVTSQQGGEGVGVATYDNKAIGEIVDSEVSGTITSNTGGGGETQNPAFVRENLTVRRLTPIECERLQGFPDNWTSEKMELILEGNEWKATGKVVKQADGPRYKAMGNAVTVNVAEWIGKQIGKVLS